MNQKQKTQRAQSNVRAACKQIGVVGVLGQLEALMLKSAVQFSPESEINQHYTSLSLILEKAYKDFRTECQRADRAMYDNLPSGATYPEGGIKS